MCILLLATEDQKQLTDGCLLAEESYSRTYVSSYFETEAVLKYLWDLQILDIMYHPQGASHRDVIICEM